jgi:hypothetical protein
MKSIKYLTVLIFALFLSCEDVLDRAPLDKISETMVWSDAALVNAYVTNLYSRFPFFAFEQDNWYSWSDEGTRSTGNSSTITQGTVSKSSEANPFWNYSLIRDCNTFLSKIKTAAITESVKKQLEGEVRFIRAYIYFEMMKRYGGVPLVDIVIDPYGNIEDKYKIRAKEEEIANFIDSECTLAASLMSESIAPRGKSNKWTALALQARSNLWAASIAKFSAIEINGLVGIATSKANAFYQKAAAAADAVIASGKYALYNATPANKAENYRKIFLVENNSEVIFVKPYDGVNIGHSWDAWQGPNQWSTRGGLCDPTLDFVLRYENIDGSADQPKFGPGILYSNGAEPFAKKDPRLFATVFFQGDKWATGTVQSYEGLDPSITPTVSAVISNSSQSYQGVPCIGADSRSLTKDDYSTNSGFHVKKYLDDSAIKIPENQSKTNWIAFRLAEIYLIKAEAEFEQGNLKNAVDALNKTRSRAGISLLDESTITREKVRTERTSELAFESQRYWDLRRWRTAQAVLNYRFQGLQIILHHATMKYYFIPFNCESFTRAFKQEHYYNPITSGRIDNNPKLIENPLY